MRRFFLLFFLAKKSAPEHQNALEPKELLWIPMLRVSGNTWKPCNRSNITSSSPWVEFVTEAAICTISASSSTEEVEGTLLAHSVIETYQSPVQFRRNINVRVVSQKLMP